MSRFTGMSRTSFTKVSSVTVPVQAVQPAASYNLPYTKQVDNQTGNVSRYDAKMSKTVMKLQKQNKDQLAGQYANVGPVVQSQPQYGMSSTSITPVSQQFY